VQLLLIEIISAYAGRVKNPRANLGCHLDFRRLSAYPSHRGQMFMKW
jgi:hypothetical protein